MGSGIINEIAAARAAEIKANERRIEQEARLEKIAQSSDWIPPLPTSPLDRIKEIVRTMPYGDVMELSEAIATQCGDVDDKKAIADALWNWSTIAKSELGLKSVIG